MRRSLAALALAAASPAVAACASLPVKADPVKADPAESDLAGLVEDARGALAHPEDRPQTVRELEAALDRSGASPAAREGALRLAELHLLAALEEPFRRAEAVRASLLAPIGDGAREEPSAESHLVASVYWASRAGALASERPAGSLQTEPRLLSTLAFWRLGFESEVEEVLARSPALLAPERCLALLEREAIPPALGAWILAMVQSHLAGRDELAAYRFAVLAIEADERLGRGLPLAEVERLEGWITEEARARFVCPRSGTPYVPGQRRSPVTGVPHYDYVAVDPHGVREAASGSTE